MPSLKLATLSIGTGTAAAAVQGIERYTEQYTRSGKFAIPARIKLSPIIVAAYALDGATPRMLHICPYADLNERMRVRGESASSGIWPPKGGPDWLTVMQATICTPAKFSPLR